MNMKKIKGTMTLILMVILVGAFALLLTACPSGGGGDPPSPPPFMEMVNIPGITGWIVEGSNPADGTATLTAFKMGKYEVTQEQWTTVMGTGTNPSYFDGSSGGSPYAKDTPAGEVQSKRPVEQVSWYDAIEFCNALSLKEGFTPAYTIDKTNQDPNNTNSSDPIKWTVTINAGSNGYRLPTEAQWQYAAQAGNSTEYTAETAEPYNAWHSGNSGSKTHEVGKLQANGFGLHDMLGNVWEWCWDWYGAAYPSDPTDPEGVSSGSYRVLRGGGWGSSASYTRSADRGYDGPDNRSRNLGVRVARPAQ